MTDEFIDGLVKTNKLHTFFVDWEKSDRNANHFKDELSLLSSLTAAEEPTLELKRLLIKYPRINMLIPLLSACRIKKPKEGIVVLDSGKNEIIYTFSDKNLDADQIESTIDFSQKTGLLAELVKISNHKDYYFGVEVGMDTNARKNRSGTAMETLVEPYIEKFTTMYGGRYLTQTNFEKASKIFDVNCPEEQKNKKGDFMLLVEDQPINIETNFFDGNGSKQEVINSYISRAESLNEAGWKFGVVTDGPGWKSNRYQVDLAYSRIKNIYNIKMVIDGSLADILK